MAQTGYSERELARLRKRSGPIAKRERRLAFAMLAPTALIILSIVLFPLFANFWIGIPLRSSVIGYC